MKTGNQSGKKVEEPPQGDPVFQPIDLQRVVRIPLLKTKSTLCFEEPDSEARCLW